MEVFKDVVGYEGFYKISNIGNVKSLSRTILKNGIYPFKSKEKNLKNRFNNNYYYVTLCKNNTYKTFRNHRLIAMAFIPNPNNKPMVNHINGIKTDNRIENLEWCTSKENVNHAISTGLINQNGVNSINSRLTEKEILEIRSLNLPHLEISEKYNISKSYVSSIKRRRTWKHI